MMGISWCAFVTVFPCHCDSSLMGFCPLFSDVRFCSMRDNVLLFLVMRDILSCVPVTVFLCHCDASLFLYFSFLSCLPSFVSRVFSCVLYLCIVRDSRSTHALTPKMSCLENALTTGNQADTTTKRYERRPC